MTGDKNEDYSGERSEADEEKEVHTQQADEENLLEEDDQDEKLDTDQDEEDPEEDQAVFDPLALKKELDRRDAELMRRVKQSSKARNDAVNDEITRLKGLMKDTLGVEVDEAQEKVLRDQVEKQFDELDNPTQEDLPDDGDQAESQRDQIARYVFEQSSRIYERLYVDPVIKGDPEWAKIEESLKDPDGDADSHFITVMEQGQLKKARLADRKSKAKSRTPSGGAGGKRTPMPKNEKEAWDEAYPNS